MRRQPNTSTEGLVTNDRVKPAGSPQVPSISSASGTSTPDVPTSHLMEVMVEEQNLRLALRRVVANHGAPGVDGVPTEEFMNYLRAHWPTMGTQLRKGTYVPRPVRGVEIPKTSGGVRMLGIPNVVDRFIQQAVLQVLTPIFDPQFSAFSFGFRTGRRLAEEGAEWVVDLDLEKFFDRINHDILMARVARRVQDPQVLRLIRRYPQAD